MIISHKFKFIFLKTNKTAGASIEIALSKFCGEKDIITPISPEDEQIRRSLGYRGPQNYMVPLSRYSFSDWVSYNFLGRECPIAVRHWAAKNLRAPEPIYAEGNASWEKGYKAVGLDRLLETAGYSL